MANDEKIAEFTSITGASAAQAQHLLEAADWQVESAVQLYFESGAESADAVDLPQAAASARHPATDTAGVAGTSEDEVRRPDEVRRERLFDAPHMYGMYRRTAPPVVDMPLRNFREEGEAGTTDERTQTLAAIYRPPADLMDDTPLVQLKHEAEEKDKWLLINIQSQDEFASLQLNADLWGHAMIKDVIKSNFFFAQRTVPDPEAASVVQTYDLQQLPAVIILDPHTAQKMIQWSGLIQPDRFLEDILPYLDTPPSDPAAGGLMHPALKQQMFQSSAPPVMGSAGVLGLSDEDENLTRAIAASMQSNHPTTSAAAGRQHMGSHAMLIDDDDEDEDDDAILARVAAYEAASGPIDIDGDDGDAAGGGVDAAAAQAPAPPAAAPTLSAEEMQAQAAARLPAEPAPGTPGACKVAIRLPNNERVFRSFLQTDLVQALYDFALTKLPVDMAAQPFVLGSPMGAALGDLTLTLRDADACGNMYLVKWAD